MRTPNLKSLAFAVLKISRSIIILKIWASDTILDSILSEFSQFRLFYEATQYHLVTFERNLSTCGRVRAMKPFSNCRALGAPVGTIDLRVGGPKCACMRSAADESTDIGAIQYCFRFLNFCSTFKSQRSSFELRRKTGQYICDLL